MEATTEIVVGLDARGRNVVRRMHCEAPLLVRVIDEPGGTLRLALVNGAAGPLGGDRLHFRLELEPGSRVAVCSVASAMVQPGPRGDASELQVDLLVAAEASLDWSPQPTVSVVGSDHRSLVRLSTTGTSTVTMCEGVALGRHDELPGRFELRERVTIDGTAVLDHHTVFAPGALMGPGAHGSFRRLSTEVVIGGALPPSGTTVSEQCLHSTVHLAANCALTVTRS